VRLDARVERAAIALATDAAPFEACALLLGPLSEEGRTLTELRPCRNVADEPQRAFFIDPLDIMRIEEESLREGLGIFAVFHSHPQGPGTLSREDLCGCPTGWRQLLAVPGEFGFELLLCEAPGSSLSG